jgi:tRNA A37 threonylcarbamoyladenosine dehydratase
MTFNNQFFYSDFFKSDFYDKIGSKIMMIEYFRTYAYVFITEGCNNCNKKPANIFSVANINKSLKERAKEEYIYNQSEEKEGILESQFTLIALSSNKKLQR